LKLDVGAAFRELDAFVVLINGDRQTLFRFVLTDNVFVQKRFYFLRLWKSSADSRVFGLFVIIDYFVTDVYTFVANVHTRSGNQFFDLILRFTAKRTA
jgi:hypothetical protein